ncbi:hypothetical protein OIU84_009661 [Salix udensis]|uniref:Bromo domain-containing protein n=1 Tax=Salix udensis TaxID=889485 RepID=A0AAD6JSQ0_9ROSI|nr:hypothetical protein OIU84_009661 [Salix udensis]
MGFSEPSEIYLFLVYHCRKDTYGVFSEPEDLDELPDYLDVIEHPMDFGTVKKKLSNGAYGSLELFEALYLKGSISRSIWHLMRTGATHISNSILQLVDECHLC